MATATKKAPAVKKAVVSKAAGATPAGRAAKVATKAAGRHAAPPSGVKAKAAASFAAADKAGAKAAEYNPGIHGTKLLMTEFLVCFGILGAGTLLAPAGSKDGVPRLMTRGTGLCILFLILSLIGSSGPKAAKTAGALGGLVTVSYVVLSTDAVNVFLWMKSFFGPPTLNPGQKGFTGPVTPVEQAQQNSNPGGGIDVPGPTVGPVQGLQGD